MRQKILVVDDDPAIRSLLQMLLEEAGYEIALADSFVEGKRALAAERPDLLIADMRLGEFNGLQLAIASGGRVPTIIVTGFPDPVLEDEARRLNADFVTKPFRTSALLDLVAARLSAPSGSAHYSVNRRWTRKRVPGLPARVLQWPARVLDVSYGGLRLEVDGEGEEIPTSFTVNLPSSRVSVMVDLVWKSRLNDRNWLCGASVSDANPAAARAWCGLVDATAPNAPSV